MSDSVNMNNNINADTKQIESIIKSFNSAINECNEMLSRDGYIEKSDVELWLLKYHSILKNLTMQNRIQLKKNSEYPHLYSLELQYRRMANNIWHMTDNHNKKQALKKMKNAASLLNSYGVNYNRDELYAIVREDDNQLIISDVNCDNAKLIAGKINYIIDTKQCGFNEILVLSATETAAKNLHNYLIYAINGRVDNMSVESYATNIYSANKKQKNYNIADTYRYALLYLRNNNSYEYRRLLYEYLVYCNIELYYMQSAPEKYKLQLRQYKTLNKETVYRYGDKLIADALFEWGVDYKLVSDTDLDTPYFLLNSYDIELQLCKAEKLQANKNTEESFIICIKNTQTQESFDIDYDSDSIMVRDKLYKKLIELNIKINNVSPKTIDEFLNKNNELLIDLALIVSVYIKYMKNNGISIEMLRKKASEKSGNISIKHFLKLIEPIIHNYNNYLSAEQKYDIIDIINGASTEAEKDEFKVPYKYIFLNEFECFTQPELMLINKLRSKGKIKLICVGDNNQNISFYNGGKEDNISSFVKAYRYAEINKLTNSTGVKNAAFNAAFDFINDFRGKALFRKNIQSALKEINCSTQFKMINRLLEELNKLPINASVFILGRYSDDLKLLRMYKNFNVLPINSGATDVILNEREDLRIKFMTIASSKGSHADYVFIINNNSGNRGFPNVALCGRELAFLKGKNRLSLDEEKRLMYIALTRADKRVTLLSQKNHESQFILSLREHYGKL